MIEPHRKLIMLNKTNIQFTPLYTKNYPQTFTAYEKTFVMLKPDSFQRNVDGIIMDKINSTGLKVLKQWEGIAPRQKLEENYSRHKEKPFFTTWIDFLSSGKIKAMIIGGEDAISAVSALKKSVREEFAPGQKRYNLMHSSDDTKSAQKECKNFFDIDI